MTTLLQTSDYPLLFRARNPAPYFVDEMLGVNAAGLAVHHQAAASATNRRDQAGSYAAELTDELKSRSADLAARLSELAPDDTAVFRRAIQLTVTASAGSQSVSHALHRVPPERLPGPAREALDLYSVLQHTLVSSPYAVVQLAAKLVRPPAGAAAPGRIRLMLQVHNPGTQQVSFKFRPDSFHLSAHGPDGLSPVWQSGAERLTGFVDPEARLVDGIRIPARLGPGQRAALLIPLAEATPSGKKLQVSADGRIELLVPGRKPSTEPSIMMSLLCELSENG